ncbi:MAG TPA: hypothetical protein VF175_08455 [Lacipirellula sp.]
MTASLVAGSQAAAQVAYVAYDPVDAVCGCESPVAVTAWYAATPTYVYGDPVVMRARYRPILGGVVTRLRYVNYGYAPAYYAPGWWW